jgi:uncharacterized membrane protein
MTDPSPHLLVAAYDEEATAEAVLNQLKGEDHDLLAGIQGVVVLHKDAKGQVHSKDVGLTPGKGAAGGALLGAIVGVLTGGAGVVLGAAGALAGAALGKRKRDQRFAPGRVNQIAAALDPSTSAILAIVDLPTASALLGELERSGADILTTAIDDGVD